MGCEIGLKDPFKKKTSNDFRSKNLVVARVLTDDNLASETEHCKKKIKTD